MIKNLVKNKLAVRSLLVMMVNLGGIGCGFLLQLYLTNAFDISTYGSYIYHMTVINFMVVAVKGGVDLAANRYIPTFVRADAGDELVAYLKFSNLYVLISSMIVIAVCYSLKGVLWSDTTGRLYFDLISIAVAVLAFLQLQCGVLQAMHSAVLSQFLQTIARPLLIIMAVFAWVYVSPNIDDSQLIIAFIATSVFLALLAFGFVYRKASSQFANATTAPIKTKVWLLSAYGMGAVVLFNLVINQFDVFFVGAYLGSEEAAIYNVALRLATLVQFPAIALGMVMAPQIAKMWASKETAKIEKIVHVGSLVCLVFSIIVSLTIWLLADILLGLFGEEYRAGKEVLVILCAARCVNSFGGLAGYLMTMTGHQKAAAKVLLISALFCIASNIYFVMNIGIEGGAIANLLSTIVWIALMSVAAIYYLKISPAFIYKCQKIE